MRKFMKCCAFMSALCLVSCKSQETGEFKQTCPVIDVTPTTVEIKESYSASIQGRQDIEIYPQVSGTIFRMYVEEGSKVRKGEILFVVDQVPYKTALRTATANVHSATAQVETAQLDYDSKKMLFQENVISEYELSMAKNALAVAEAGLEQARAEEINARNNLSYTEVKSPSDGVVGILPYRVGALVSPSIPQPLTTVSDNSEMYVYFSMTENQLRALIRQYGSPDETIRQMPSVRLQLNDGTIYDHEGRIETISGIINRQTGTASIRSVFPNEKRVLFSGGIGNVIIPRTIKETIVIPQSATYELQDKIFAYKIDKESKINSVELTVEKLNDGKNYIVYSGLEAGDRIVSEGVGLLQDGMEILVEGTDKNQEKE